MADSCFTIHFPNDCIRRGRTKTVQGRRCSDRDDRLRTRLDAGARLAGRAQPFQPSPVFLALRLLFQTRSRSVRAGSQAGGFPEGSRGLRNVATTPPVQVGIMTRPWRGRRTVGTHLKLWHPSRVLGFCEHTGGVAPVGRSTPGYFLASFQDAAEVSPSRRFNVVPPSQPAKPFPEPFCLLSQESSSEIGCITEGDLLRQWLARLQL